MADSVMAVPVSARFCIDMVRFSDGRFTLEDIGAWAEEQILSIFERNYDSLGSDWFGDRALEFAEIYFPHIAGEWERANHETTRRYQKDTKPLVWKEVTVPHGSEVRMHYAGEYHFGTVKNGRVVDDNGSYSPSKWASKVAGGTSRSAWRDLWFKKPLESIWIPAQLLRDQARSELQRRMA